MCKASYKIIWESNQKHSEEEGTITATAITNSGLTSYRKELVVNLTDDQYLKYQTCAFARNWIRANYDIYICDDTEVLIEPVKTKE